MSESIGVIGGGANDVGEMGYDYGDNLEIVYHARVRMRVFR